MRMDRQSFLRVIGFLGSFIGTASAQAPSSLAGLSAAIENLAKSASPAVVQITVRVRAPIEGNGAGRAGFLANETGTGSGVIIDPAGYIVTNAHVVRGARRIDVSVAEPHRPDSSDRHLHYPGKVVGIDADTDLAVVKIEASKLPTLTLADSRDVKQGQLVVALGSPLGLANSLTVGFVSATLRHLKPDEPMFYIQTDAPINPGNSGGPLLDSSGRVVGINTMILSQSGGREGIGFAIPSNLVRRVYSDIRAHGRVRRGAIGVVPQDITPTLAAALGIEHASGVLLSDIVPHGSAEAAGLQPGDIVLAIDGVRIHYVRQLMAAVFQHAYGDEIKLDIQRGQQSLQKVVSVLDRPDSSGGLSELASQDARLVRQLGVLALTVDSKVTAILPDLRRLSGVAVAAISAEFAALNPGLAAGDVIYEVNRRRVESLEDLAAALDSKKPGDAVALLVEREGRLIYVAFELE